MFRDRKDLGAGLAFIGIALLYGGIAYRSLPMGQTLNMGPGYFPAVLCTILLILGGVLVVRSGFAKVETPFLGTVAWRPILAISAAILFFGTFLREAGLFPAILVTAFVCTLASRRVDLARAGIIALGLALVCTLIFVYGVRLPVPVIGSWFTR